MNEEERWQEPEDGITLGPEEVLRREIEKSKNLKVERLQLKDEIEKLRAENSHLTQKNQALNEEIKTARSIPKKDTAPSTLQPVSTPSQKWPLIFCIVNVCALAIFLYLCARK